MIQMHNEITNGIGLDWDLGWLEVVSLESKEEYRRNDKETLKNHMLQIRMIMQKFHMTMQIRPNEEFVL